MELDSQGDTKCSTEENGFQLYPVSRNDSGTGLPYAPMDWPKPGDKWTWKVGKRVTHSGHFMDRCLYPPSRLMKGPRQKYRFKSRPAVEQYIRTTFPDADANAFFASFSWKIPSKPLPKTIGDEEGLVASRVKAEPIGTDSQVGKVGCKAGNARCISLKEPKDTPPNLMSCDICCSESGFCLHCCCILCCGTVSSAFESYNYIRCEATLDGGYICGHIAHIDCGIRAYMAGTIRGSIGLDAEYYCRRCDSRTDLVSHVMKLLQTCETTDSKDEIEKTLNVGICLLQGSRKPNAEQLVHQIKCAMVKLKGEAGLEGIWRKEDVPTITRGGTSDSLENAAGSMTHGEFVYCKTEPPKILSLPFDHRVESLKLEDEINQTLQSLRRSQEYEYRVVEETLLVQKNHIHHLYEQLDKKRPDLSKHVAHSEASHKAVLERVDQIKREVDKLNDMKEVGKGLGRTSNRVLKEHFGLGPESL